MRLSVLSSIPRRWQLFPATNSWLLRRAHFNLHPSKVYNRTLFQRRDQLPGKSVSAYKAALRKLAADCDFGTLDLTMRLYVNSTMVPLEVMLRDRFVYGLRNAHIRQPLFAGSDLYFKMAYDITLRVEGMV